MRKVVIAGRYFPGGEEAFCPHVCAAGRCIQAEMGPDNESNGM